MSANVETRLIAVFDQVLGPAVTREIVAKPHQGHPAWDSIAQINLVMAVEQEFRVSFTPEEAGLTMTFEALKETLAPKVPA